MKHSATFYVIESIFFLLLGVGLWIAGIYTAGSAAKGTSFNLQLLGIFFFLGSFGLFIHCAVVWEHTTQLMRKTKRNHKRSN